MTFQSLFVLKEAYHSEKMEGVIPAAMTFGEYCVQLVAKRTKEKTMPDTTTKATTFASIRNDLDDASENVPGPLQERIRLAIIHFEGSPEGAAEEIVHVLRGQLDTAMQFALDTVKGDKHDYTDEDLVRAAVGYD